MLAVHYPKPEDTWIGAIMPKFKEESIWKSYVIALYWVLTTFTTVGYGDVHSMNILEYISTMIILIFNYVLGAFLCGCLGNMVVHGHETQRFRETLEASRRFGLRNKLSGDVQGDINRHFQLDYRLQLERLQDENFIHMVPKALRYKIGKELFEALVAEAYLFEEVSSKFLFQLTAEVKAEYFPPMTDLIMQDELSTEFYIIVSGTVELLVKNNNGADQLVGTATRGEVCGELGVLCCMDQLFNVRTRTLTQLLRVDRKMFLEIAEEKSEDLSTVMRNVCKRVNALEYPGMARIFADMAYLIETGQSKLPVSPYFAASTGNHVLLGHLLKKRCLDANQLNLSGETALHVAILKESTKCVELLLEAGADPNRKDPSGDIPLWKAMIDKKEVMVQLFEKYDAKLPMSEIGACTREALILGRVDLLEGITRFGGDIKLFWEGNGNTALHVAVIKKHTKVVEYLLEKGLDMDAENNDKLTPYSLARQGGYKEIIALMEKARANASGSGSG